MSDETGSAHGRMEPTVGPYWLIEYFPCAAEPNKRPLWWNGVHWNAHEDGAWTDDANNAIRFVSQTEALVVACALLRYNVREVKKVGLHTYQSIYGTFRPTEHLWLNARIEPTAHGEKPED